MFSCFYLSELCIQLGLNSLDKLVHYLLNLDIVKSLALILQQETNSVALLACRQVLTLIYIKQGYLLEQLALSLVSQTLYIGKLDALVNKQCQVTANGR